MISWIICAYVTFRRNWGTGSGPKGFLNSHTADLKRWGHVLGCSWEHALWLLYAFPEQRPVPRYLPHCNAPGSPHAQYCTVPTPKWGQEGWNLLNFKVRSNPTPKLRFYDSVPDGATQHSHCPWGWLDALWGTLSQVCLCCKHVRGCTLSKEQVLCSIPEICWGLHYIVLFVAETNLLAWNRNKWGTVQLLPPVRSSV